MFLLGILADSEADRPRFGQNLAYFMKIYSIVAIRYAGAAQTAIAGPDSWERIRDLDFGVAGLF